MSNMMDKESRKAGAELLTFEEAAQELGISLSGISKAVKRGRIGTVQFKYMRLIPRSALDAYVKSKSKGGRPRKRT
jgi:excisionase family DNA binding protein